METGNDRFVRNFRATPHTTTRVPPATALFRRHSNKTKLPEFNEGQQEPTLEANDRNVKMKMKRYADAKAYVRPSTIKTGDTVFERRDDSKRKQDTPYRREPSVIAKKGSMVTASNKSGTITRNSSYFKKAPTESDSQETSDDEDSDVPMGQPEVAVIEAPELPRYPRRARRRPIRYGAQLHAVVKRRTFETFI